MGSKHFKGKNVSIKILPHFQGYLLLKNDPVKVSENLIGFLCIILYYQ